MKDKISLREFLRKYDAGDFNNPSVSVQMDAGWYDWFCRGYSLFGRTKKLVNKLKTLLPSDKIDLDNNYVFFKNNCPVSGPLYDDFRICEISSKNLIWTIVPKHGKNGGSQVWGLINDFSCPVIKGNWSDVKKYFRNDVKNLEVPKDTKRRRFIRFSPLARMEE